ncbi:MAG: shikimate dehydrogenase [Clostridia bacterium]|nr:shikimate dehydrogenase [Clostridia bacterium]
MYQTAKTELLGVFGCPIGHTLSPKLHSILAEQTNKDLVYLAFSATDEELGDKVNALKTLNARGFNITIPHKVRIMEYLDVIDETAALIGAVNTAVNKNGIWHGYNTDGLGFLKSLKLNNVNISGKNILMLGAGGSCRSVAFSLADVGAESITIISRTKEKAQNIGDLIEKHTPCKFLDTFSQSKTYDIIINTTPLGMKPYENENPFNHFEVVSKDTVCCDFIYSPWETNFLKEAKRNGAKTINGLGMLTFQGIFAYEHFFGEKYDDAFFEKIYKIFSQDFRK